MQGKAWAPICRAAANLGVRARGWETGVIPGGGFGRQLRCGGGRWTCRWGHGVSGSEAGARVSDRASASGSRAGVDVRGPGGSEGERERPTRSWAVREVERAQLGFGAGASEVSGLGESWLGRAREGRKGVGRGFGWARLGLGFGFAAGLKADFFFGFFFQISISLLSKSNSNKV